MVLNEIHDDSKVFDEDIKSFDDDIIVFEDDMKLFRDDIISCDDCFSLQIFI